MRWRAAQQQRNKFVYRQQCINRHAALQRLQQPAVQKTAAQMCVQDTEIYHSAAIAQASDTMQQLAHTASVGSH
jgi:hypothetical protein